MVAAESRKIGWTIYLRQLPLLCVVFGEDSLARTMFNGPPRGGTRGGRDQFSWEDVKNDADRENFLGNSVMAPVGRWQVIE